MAAAALPAGALLKLAGMDLLSDFINKMFLQPAGQAAAGAFGPPVTQGGSNSKFMITLQDVRDIQQYVNNENFKRFMMGRKDFLDAKDEIRDREAQLRRSAAEAGAREYAIEQLKQQGAVQSGLAQAAGTGSTALSEVIKQGIASTLNRPDYGTIMSEVGRAF